MARWRKFECNQAVGTPVSILFERLSITQRAKRSARRKSRHGYERRRAAELLPPSVFPTFARVDSFRVLGALRRLASGESRVRFLVLNGYDAAGQEADIARGVLGPYLDGVLSTD